MINLVKENIEKIKNVPVKDLTDAIIASFNGYIENGESEVILYSPSQNGDFIPNDGEHYAHINTPNAIEVVFKLKKDSNDSTETHSFKKEWLFTISFPFVFCTPELKFRLLRSSRLLHSNLGLSFFR